MNKIIMTLSCLLLLGCQYDPVSGTYKLLSIGGCKVDLNPFFNCMEDEFLYLVKTKPNLLRLEG